MLKYILFDFDGTLVDSRQAFINSFNKLAHKYKFNKIDAGNIEELKQLSMIERLRYLKVPVYRLPFLTKEFLSLYKLEFGSVILMPGILQLLEKINELELKTGIVSSNSAVTIKTFLRDKEIQSVADVCCSSRLFGKHRVFKKFLKERCYSADEVIYVCDELRDIEACRKVGIKPVWVSWGFEVKDVIGRDSVQCAHSPEELLKIIEIEKGV